MTHPVLPALDPPSSRSVKLDITLIARRSADRSGTRHWRRGADTQVRPRKRRAAPRRGHLWRGNVARASVQQFMVVHAFTHRSISSRVGAAHVFI
jgi:hypothetical protein